MSSEPALTPACTRCGHRSRVGARFCGGCGSPLSKPDACPACGAPRQEDQRFCEACGAAFPAAAPPVDARTYTPPDLAQKILLNRNDLEGERKQVTVLFADVKESMRLTEMVDGEAWRSIMDRFFAILAGSVHDFEGTVTRFTGDGIMALFGAPIAHEDHARRACLAGLRMKDALSRYALELQQERGLSFRVRIGINSGEVIVGTIGDDLHMDYTAVGHSVGLAARVEEKAEPGTIYITANTAELATGFCRYTDLGLFEIRGHQDPLRLFELTGIGEAHSSLEVAQSRGFSRFVGRDDEMAALETAFGRAIDGHAEVVAIVGEPGVGKSRLCYEFVESLRAQGIPVREARCISHGKSIPLLPFLDLFRNLFRISDQDAEETARQRIRDTLLGLDPGFADALPLMYDFLAVPDPDAPAPRMDPEARQRQLFAIVRRITHARSRQQPAVILFEDLHWIDGASEALLASLVEALPGTRTLMVLNFRPEYRCPWAHKSYYRQIPLLPLDGETTAALLFDLLGGDLSVASLSAHIRERTGGNPFFVEQVVRSLAETGSLEGARGAYQLTHPLDEVAIPPTVQTAVAARIDRLGDSEKVVLQTAAVLGREFDEPVLARVMGCTPGELSGALGRLVETEHIYLIAVAPDGVYAFKHPLIQEVAYSSQLAERRARVHVRIAQTIEELYPEGVDERAAVIAQHWELGGEGARAAAWWRRAAEWVGASDPAAALRNWQRVRALVAANPPADGTLELELAACIASLRIGWRLGASEASARKLLEDGRALAATGDRHRDLIHLLVAFAGDRLAAGDLPESLEYAVQSMHLADGEGDRDLRVAVRQNVAALYVLMGHLAEAGAVLEEGLELTDGDHALGEDILGFSPAIWFLMTRAAWIDTLQGRLPTAAAELGRVIGLAESRGETEILGWAHGYLAHVGWLQGDGELAMHHAEQSLHFAEKIGTPFSNVHADIAVALAHLMHGNWAKAAGRLENTLEMGRAQRTGLNREALILSYLAEAEAGINDHSAARTHAGEALAVARRQGSLLFECIAQLTRAGAMLSADDLDTAGEGASEIEAALEAAQRCVDETGARVYEPFIQLHRAGLAAWSGDWPGRDECLARARRLFTEVGASGRASQLPG